MAGRFIFDPESGQYIDTRTGKPFGLYDSADKAMFSGREMGKNSSFNNPSPLALKSGINNESPFGMGAAGQKAGNTIEQMATNQPSQPTPWGDYAAMAAKGAAPVANSILANRRPQAQLLGGTSLGSHGMIDPSNFYAMFKGKGAGTNSILARLLRNR